MLDKIVDTARLVEKRDVISRGPNEIQLVADNESISLKRIILYLEAKTQNTDRIDESSLKELFKSIYGVFLVGDDQRNFVIRVFKSGKPFKIIVNPMDENKESADWFELESCKFTGNINVLNPSSLYQFNC